MKNILKRSPYQKIHGRLLFSTKFTRDKDLENKKILDIGCGYGWFELYALTKNIKYITGTEISKSNLSTAKQHIHNHKIKFQIANALSLPFPDNSFDTIVSWEVLEHIPKHTETKMFSEVYRVLRPKGTFYMSTPFDSFLSKIFDPAWWLINHRHYSQKQLQHFAKSTGFIVKKIKTKGKWAEILNINNLYISKWIFHRRPFFEKHINQLRNKEYKNNQKGFMYIFAKFKK